MPPMPRPLLVAVLCLAGALAGCTVSDPAPKPPHDLGVVSLPDGYAVHAYSVTPPGNTYYADRVYWLEKDGRPVAGASAGESADGGKTKRTVTSGLLAAPPACAQPRSRYTLHCDSREDCLLQAANLEQRPSRRSTPHHDASPAPRPVQQDLRINSTEAGEPIPRP